MYENDYIGKIVNIRGIVFDNYISNKKEVDHAYNTGRPCIIIYSDEEYDYFLTMSSSMNVHGQNFEFFKLNSDDYMYLYKYVGDSHKNVFEGYINLKKVYKKKVSGFGMDDKGKIKFEVYKKLMEKFKKYHNYKELNDICEKASELRTR